MIRIFELSACSNETLHKMRLATIREESPKGFNAKNSLIAASNFAERLSKSLMCDSLSAHNASLAVALIQPTLNILMQNAGDEGLVGNTFCQSTFLQAAQIF